MRFDNGILLSMVGVTDALFRLLLFRVSRGLCAWVDRERNEVLACPSCTRLGHDQLWRGYCTDDTLAEPCRRGEGLSAGGRECPACSAAASRCTFLGWCSVLFKCTSYCFLLVMACQGWKRKASDFPPPCQSFIATDIWMYMKCLLTLLRIFVVAFTAQELILDGSSNVPRRQREIRQR